MLHMYFLQQWCSLSDPPLEEAFADKPLYLYFAQLEELGQLPDEPTLLHIHHRLKKHKLAEKIMSMVNGIPIQRGLLLKTGAVVNATLIAAPS
jgi:IS5 family transposase